jgi:hypothetical protein
MANIQLTQYQRDLVLGKREAIKFLNWMDKNHADILDAKIPRNIHLGQLNELYLLYCDKGQLSSIDVFEHFGEFIGHNGNL